MEDAAHCRRTRRGSRLCRLLSRGYQPVQGERVGVLVCGGNTTAVDFTPATDTGPELVA